VKHAFDLRYIQNGQHIPTGDLEEELQRKVSVVKTFFNGLDYYQISEYEGEPKEVNQPEEKMKLQSLADLEQF